VRKAACLAALLVAAAPGPTAHAHPLRSYFLLDRVNRSLHGRVVDYTHNHGADRRIWSEALGEKRDLYVYLPPGYDPCKRYALMIWLHGFAQDEYSFLADVVGPLDQAVADGRLPPLIVAAPDGSLRGNSCGFNAGSFFVNSPAGNFEDFLMADVWDFVTSRYPVRPEPGAHVIAGVSMGGGAAFNKAIKYPDRFQTVLGIFPPLNVRWTDCRGRWNAPFDPDCWGWRTDFDRPCHVVGRFYGVVTIRMRDSSFPLYGRRNPDMLPEISRNNPVEMLEPYQVRPGQLNMYVGYGGRDEFNIGAEVESFLFVARSLGLAVETEYDPEGRHDRPTALRLMPRAIAWLGAQLAPYPPE
jgi:pimeloyl-ACP methyl ester carboxylesterase